MEKNSLSANQQVMFFRKGSCDNSSYCVDQLNGVFATEVAVEESGERRNGFSPSEDGRGSPGADAHVPDFNLYVFTPEEFDRSGLSNELEGALQVTARSDQFIWDGARAIIVCSKDRQIENSRIMSQFVYCELQLRSVEQSIRADWSECEKFSRFTHELTVAELVYRKDVNVMTEKVNRWRFLYQSLATLQVLPSAALSAQSKRTFFELAVVSRFQDRLVLVDDQLEAMQELCEVACERFAEFSSHTSGLKVEKLIVWLLVIEVLLLLADQAARLFHL
ncbi:MAG TPA: hypothetical protein V6C76_12910 [Drouetiella sp.]